MKKIKAVIKRLWDFAFKTEKGLYLVFGGLTTLISIIVFWLFNRFLGGEHDFISNLAKNAAGIIFAYFTNRIYVFKSKNSTVKAKSTEAALFGITRIATLFIDWGILYMLKNYAGVDSRIGTVVGSVVVIILNYIASKLYIFKRKD